MIPLAVVGLLAVVPALFLDPSKCLPQRPTHSLISSSPINAPEDESETEITSEEHNISAYVSPISLEHFQFIVPNQPYKEFEKYFSLKFEKVENIFCTCSCRKMLSKIRFAKKLLLLTISEKEKF